MNGDSSCPFFRIVALIIFSAFISVSAAVATGGGQQCGTSADADVVIMIDRTGSVSSGEMTQQKNAAKALLNFFSSAVVKPRVAIGTFNVQSGPDARIVAGGSLTSTYGHDDPGDTGLYEAINDQIPSSGNGNTDVSAAINVAQAELAAHAQSAARYIILISDGVTNEPDANNPGSCSNNNPLAAANAAANAAEAAGTQIFAIRFGGDGSCPAGTGQGFMQNVMATAPAMYYEGNSDLSGVFNAISTALVCDDGNACTQDVCDGGTCVSTPIGLDSDNDGVPDCADVCPDVDDNQIGDECSAGVGLCYDDGIKNCRCNGNPSEPGTICQLSCNARPGTPGEEVCNGLDDDCNGTTDDVPGIGESCSAGIGACQQTGENVCSIQLGELVCSAQPGQPTSELCNGIDDNCDGEIDNGAPDQGSCTVGLGICENTGTSVCVTGVYQCNVSPGQPGTETCNGLDDDCDGAIDDGIDPTGSCSVGVGTCASQGQYICVNGGLACDAQPGQPGVEVCNGLDDDCNGLVDDGIPPSGSCSAGTGACYDAGQYVCSNGQLTCDAQAGEPGTETCNGADDNCDGNVDEGFGLGDSCVVGIGACENTGVVLCDINGGTTCSVEPLQPGIEVCDGIDNDCNEQVDEIFDVCGVQCGDGSSCATPSPSPSASPSPSPTATPQGCDGVLDACGVCNGDGTSCQCTETSFGQAITTIDGNTLALFALGKQIGNVALKEVKKGKGKSGLTYAQAKKFVNSVVAQMSTIHVESWSKANLELPQKSLTCGGAFQCASISTLPAIDKLLSNNAQTIALAKKIAKKLGVSGSPKVKFVLNALVNLGADSAAVINSFPKEVSSCDPIQQS